MAVPFSKWFRRTTAKPDAQRSFEAASPSRRRFGGFSTFGAHGPESSAAASILRGQGRHAHQNNPLARNGVTAIVAETVGAGIEANSAHPDRQSAEQIDALWLEAAAQIDAEGRTDLRGLMASMVQAERVDGEAFALLEERDGRLVVKQIPAERVDESHTTELGDGGYIQSGIEHSALGERRAYHVRPSRPNDLFTTAPERIRVPAENMLHLAHGLAPGQVRGTSSLASVLLKLSEYDQATDALAMKLKVSAMHVAFITDVNGTTESAYDPAGIGEEGLEPGAVYRLGMGEDIRTAFPDAAQDADALLKTMRREIAAGLGVPTHLLDGDLSNANYSSLRAGLLPFRARVEQYVYHSLIPQVLDPIFRRVITDAYLAGRLDLPDLGPALKAEWLPPRPMQVDPAKDAQAVRELLAMGLTSRRQAVAALGWNVADLDAEIAADREREAALGLSFTSTGGTDDSDS